MLSPAQHYSLSALITSVATLILMFFVFLRATNKQLARYFCWYTFTIAYWSLFVFACTSVPNHHLSYLLCQICHIGGVFIPIAFLNFVQVYTGNKSDLLKWIIVAGYAIIGSISLSIIFYPRLFIPDVVGKLTFYYFPEPGPLFVLWNAVFAILVFVSAIVLAYEARKKKDLDRKRLITFLIANSLGYLGGVGCFFPVYDIAIFPFPYGVWGVFAFSCVTAYAVLRYRFIDIEVIIKKTLVFTGLFGMVMTIVAAMTTILPSLLGRYWAVPPILSTAMSVLVAVLLYDPTRRVLVNLTDRFLFQKKEDFKIVLNRLSTSIITILDLDKVGKTILSTLRELLKLDAGAIILKDEANKGYYVLDSFNKKMDHRNYDPEDLLIGYLSQHESILNLEDGSVGKKLPTVLLSRLEELNAVICIPLFLHKELVGILTLGRKKSDEEFTQEELSYFPILAGQVVIALSNARQYEIQKKSQFDFIQQAKMAAIGTLSAGINHEVKNPLNVIRTGVEMLKMNDESGLYDNFSMDDYRREVNSVLNSILEEVDKASGIMTTLSLFAHKGKGTELKNEMVNLESQVDNVYALLKSEFKYNSIEFVKEFPQDLPQVLGDSARVSEVFLNIVNNARQAIGQKGKIKVVGRRNNNSVRVDIIDNGPGMTKEIQERIFDPFFTTKEQGEGTGLGLHICREILKRMDAKISMKSEVGNGTTFTIEFSILVG